MLLIITKRIILSFTIGVIVKIWNVWVRCEFGDPWRLNSLIFYNKPIDTLEPLIAFNIFSPSAEASQSFWNILFEEAGDELSGWHGDLFWKFIVPNRNSPINIGGTLVVKWWISKVFKSKRMENDTYPDNISYNKTPSAHQSTPWLCPCPIIISGARYSGVPQRV